MAYDERTAERLRRALAERDDVEERPMFGGLTFLVAGRMCIGVEGQDLAVRLGAVEADRALAMPHVRPMDFTGRPLRGFVYVAPPGFRNAAQLRRWVALGVAHAVATSPGGGRPRARRAK